MKYNTATTFFSSSLSTFWVFEVHTSPAKTKRFLCRYFGQKFCLQNNLSAQVPSTNMQATIKTSNNAWIFKLARIYLKLLQKLSTMLLTCALVRQSLLNTFTNLISSFFPSPLLFIFPKQFWQCNHQANTKEASPPWQVSPIANMALWSLITGLLMWS